MNISIWDLKDARGPVLDHIAKRMGEVRHSRFLLKEDDYDFRDRLITVLRDFLCTHENARYSIQMDTHYCTNCEKEVYRERRTSSRSAKRFRVVFEVEVDAETKEEALNQTIHDWDNVRDRLEVRVEEER